MYCSCSSLSSFIVSNVLRQSGNRLYTGLAAEAPAAAEADRVFPLPVFASDWKKSDARLLISVHAAATAANIHHRDTLFKWVVGHSSMMHDPGTSNSDQASRHPRMYRTVTHLPHHPRAGLPHEPHSCPWPSPCLQAPSVSGCSELTAGQQAQDLHTPAQYHAICFAVLSGLSGMALDGMHALIVLRASQLQDSSGGSSWVTSCCSLPEMVALLKQPT